jgi:tetratricopeptide (TPR) repeat protein
VFLFTITLLVPALGVFAVEEKPAQPRELPKEPMNVTSVPEVPADTATRKSIEEALQKKDFTAAETELVKLIEQNSNSNQLLVLLGRIFFLDKKYLNSAIAFKKAEKIKPLKEDDLFTVAMSFVILNRKDWARQELQRLAQANLKDPRYPYWLARLDYDDAQYAAAIEKLKRAIGLDANFVKAYDNLGLSYEALGEYEEAYKSYEKATDLNRQQSWKSAWPPLNFGIFLQNRGRIAEAEPYLREAVGHEPKLAQARFQLGVLLEKQKKYKDAIEELSTAVSLDPKYPEPHYALARIYRLTGDLKSAEGAAKTFQDLKQEKQKQLAQ